MKRIVTCLLLLAAAFAVIPGCRKKDKVEPLKVYAIIHEEETRALLDLFTKKTGIPAVFLHSTTGELVNRVIAEKGKPQGDVILGGASSYHMQLSDMGLLEQYSSPAASKFPKYALSKDGTWTGFCVLALGIGINEKRYREKFPGIPEPSSWEDLLNKAYKGEIVMTNPVASSTAYLFLQNQLQRLGEERGWKYILELAPLVGQFPESGSAPAKLIGTGEYALGISYLHALAKYAHEGFGVKAIPVARSVGDVDCISIIKGSGKIDESRKFVDFILSREAQELMSGISFTTPVDSNCSVPDGCVDIGKLDLMEYDADKASSEREAVLAKWTKEAR